MNLHTLHDLGPDPDTVHRLNAGAFQQSAITSFRGWQYVTYYQSSSAKPSTRHIVLARRRLQDPQKWEKFTFEDYDQTTDDGHNTISMGVCRGDGTIHVSFDHHCDGLRYRYSVKGLALQPAEFAWDAAHFSPVMDTLGKGGDAPYPLSYPRFINAEDSLLFEFRLGKAGAGSDVLYKYDLPTSTWRLQGTYLVGIGCNPYPNGLSYDPLRHRLHVSWTNRHFVDYEGANDESSVVHKAQAGPNGPENNQDLCYAYSNDFGLTWESSSVSHSGQPKQVGELAADGSSGGIISTAEDVIGINIPQNSGIMNQEAQCLDTAGGFHVLNRDNTSGQETWKHYYLPPQGLKDHSDHSEWGWVVCEIKHIQPTSTGPRGKIAYDPKSASIFFFLPSNDSATKRLYVQQAKALRPHNLNYGFAEPSLVWTGDGYDGEPLVDEHALVEEGALCLFNTMTGDDAPRKVVVLDFAIERN